MRLLLLALLPALVQAQATPSLSAPAPQRDSIPLREYVDIRFAAQDEAVKSALESAALATAKAEAASDKRFEAVNEFRASLNDQSRTLMPRAEAELAYKALEQKLTTINERVDILAGRVNSREDQGRGAGNLWGYIVGGVGVVLALLAYMGKGVTGGRK